MEILQDQLEKKFGLSFDLKLKDKNFKDQEDA